LVYLGEFLRHSRLAWDYRLFPLIQDTYRAAHSLLTIMAPSRVNSMMRSLIRIYEWSGRLPMWANVVETNIMIGTHVDAVIANALERGFRDFDVDRAMEAVYKNAFEPPENDTDLLYYDREPYTPEEARAGLTTYTSLGWVANDRWAESASRTLDYAFDDYAAAVVARHAGADRVAERLMERSKNYKHLWNPETQFMEARNENGTFAGPAQGWTEGDDWIYTFNVMHDVAGLAELFGGREKVKEKLDAYFEGGHNDHSNEPSHHAPYLYTMLGYPASTQKLTRQIAWANYNATSAGLSGNEDLGQMSAWYCFSAIGFYPANPASDEYVVGSPFFEKITIRLPAGVANGGDVFKGGERTLTISAPGAPTKPFVKALRVDGDSIHAPVVRHNQIVSANHIEFEMADTPQDWGAGKIHQ
jgi:predicted alpha-1,2-mannosidase